MGLSKDAVREIEQLERENPLFFSVSKLKSGVVGEFIADFSTAKDKIHDIGTDSRTLMIDCEIKKWYNCEVCYENINISVHFPLKTFIRRLYQFYRVSLLDNSNKYLIKIRKKYSKGKNYSFDILECKEVEK